MRETATRRRSRANSSPRPLQLQSAPRWPSLELEGSATFEVGDETAESGPGIYLFGPRDIPHRWTAGPDGARLLYLFAPAGMEELIPLSGVAAETLTPPPPDVVPPSDAVEIAARFGGEILAFSPPRRCSARSQAQSEAF